MKIALILSKPSREDKRNAIAQARMILDNGGDVTIILGEGDHDGDFRRMGLTPLRYPFTDTKRARKNALADIAHQLAARHIDLIQGSSKDSKIISELGESISKPNIVKYSDTLKSLGFLQGLSLRYLKKAAAIVTPSDFIKVELQKSLPASAHKIISIHESFEVEHFQAEQVSPERMIALAEKWRLREEVPSLLIPLLEDETTFSPEIINSLQRLTKDLDFQALFILPRDFPSSLRKKISVHLEANGLAGTARLLDEVSDIPAMLMLADGVGFFPQRPPGKCPLLLKALAMGRPVVAYDMGCLGEYIENGVTGITLAKHTQTRVNEALQHALSLDKAARDLVADNARRVIQKEFSQEGMCNQYFLLYSKLLESPSQVERP